MGQLTKYVMEMALRGVYKIGPTNVISVKGKRGSYDGFFLDLFTQWYKLDIVPCGVYQLYKLTQPLCHYPREDDGQIDREFVAVFDSFEAVLKWLE